MDQQILDTYLNKVVEHFEGFSGSPYLDDRGHCTIGYGINLEVQSQFLALYPTVQAQVQAGTLYGAALRSTLIACGMGWDEATAREATKQVVLQALKAMEHVLPWTRQLDSVRECILLDMAFNMGVVKLLDFKHMLAALQSGDHETAAQEMLDSDWAREVKTRALTLSNWMRTGVMA